jgi:hypothetical protein
MKKFFMSFFIFLMLFTVSNVYAYHIYYPYNDSNSRGYFQMSKNGGYSTNLTVHSNNCNSEETTAFSNVKSSTTSTSEMDRWLGGINYIKICSNPDPYATDIYVDYSDWSQTHPSDTTSGGENHSTIAPANYCAYVGTTYPCGSHPSTVHINLTKWNNTSSTGKVRLIMHETSHSLGLAHHCTGDSIMNNGASTCNAGSWTSVMSFQPTDRSGISSIYPR